MEKKWNTQWRDSEMAMPGALLVAAGAMLLFSVPLSQALSTEKRLKETEAFFEISQMFANETNCTTEDQDTLDL